MEGLADVGSALIAHGDAAEAGEPSQGALDDPAMTAQAVGAINAATGDARRDAPRAAGQAAGGVIIGFVGMQLGGPAPWPAAALPDRLYRVEHRPEHAAVVVVGRAQANSERDAVGIDQKMALGARPAAIGRVRAGLSAPFWPRPRRCPPHSATSRSHWPGPADRAAPGAALPRSRLAASRAAAASRSCRSRSPSPWAASPRECRTSARTGCR